jgi:hypothetical protein
MAPIDPPGLPTWPLHAVASEQNKRRKHLVSAFIGIAPGNPKPRDRRLDVGVRGDLLFRGNSGAKSSRNAPSGEEFRNTAPIAHIEKSLASERNSSTAESSGYDEGTLRQSRQAYY